MPVGDILQRVDDRPRPRPSWAAQSARNRRGGIRLGGHLDDDAQLATGRQRGQLCLELGKPLALACDDLGRRPSHEPLVAQQLLQALDPAAKVLGLGVATRGAMRRGMNQGSPNGLPREFTDRIYDEYDRDTRRVVLELYRATGAPDRLASLLAPAFAELDRPALVLWGALVLVAAGTLVWRRRKGGR